MEGDEIDGKRGDGEWDRGSIKGKREEAKSRWRGGRWIGVRGSIRGGGAWEDEEKKR